MATVRDFMYECAMYPHSKEHFDLLKECMELRLSSKFVNDQIYMREHADYLSQNQIVLTESYFTESESDEVLLELTESIKEKAEGVKKFIKTKFKNLLTKFISFLAKIGLKIDTTTAKAAVVNRKLSSVKLSDENLRDIEEIINKAINANGNTFHPKANQPFFNKIKLNTTGSNSSLSSEIKNNLAAALSTDKIVAEAFIDRKNGTINDETAMVLPAETIFQALEILKKSGKLTKANCVTATTSLTAAWANVKKNGLEVNVKTHKIAEAADKLKSLNEKLQQAWAAEAEFAGTIGNAAKEVASSTSEALGGKALDAENKVDLIEAINKLYEPLNICLSQTMSVYSSINNYRYTVINGLDSYLKSFKENIQTSTGEGNDDDFDFTDDDNEEYDDYE